jgi:hypothetical protein
VVLHGNDGCISGFTAVAIALHADTIFKLERQCRKKNGMLRPAKFQNRGFSQLGPSTAQGSDLYGDANGCRARKEAGQLRGAIGLMLVDDNLA